MIRSLVACVLLVAACGDAKDEPPPEPEVAESKPRAPDPPLPVTLPSVETYDARRLIETPAFIAVRGDGTTIGHFAGHLRARGAKPVAKLDELTAQMATLFSDDTAQPAITESAIGWLPADTTGADILALVDADRSVTDLLDVLFRISNRRLELGVQANGVGRVPYLFGGDVPGASRTIALSLEVHPETIVMYGTTVSWNNLGSELETLIADRRKSSSMSIRADLVLDPEISMPGFVALLGMLSAHGVPYIQLTRGAAPAVPANDYLARNGTVPTVSIGQPVVTGALEKAIVRRYIKRNIQKITYCYEKALLAKADLAGTVSARWTITESGTVSGATATGVSPEVSSCIKDVIAAIEFPKPKAGVVNVTYPLVFRTSGS